MPRFDRVGFLQAVQQYGVTHTYVVPTMMSRLLALPAAVKDEFDVSSFTAFQHGAAPCRELVKRAIIDWFGPVVIEQYGSTEGNGMLLVGTEEWLARPGTVGRPLLGEIVILDGDGTQLPPGHVGEVWFRGATNFEYFNAPDLTAEAQSATGDMSTMGDIGYVDDDGYPFLTDRKAFTIVSGGVNVYPQEVENVLGDHPLVRDVAVLGVPSEEFGQEVKAAVQLEPDVGGGPDLERELIAVVHQRQDTVTAVHAEFSQLPGDPVGPVIQLVEAVLGVLGDHGDPALVPVQGRRGRADDLVETKKCHLGPSARVRHSPQRNRIPVTGVTRLSASECDTTRRGRPGHRERTRSSPAMHEP